MHDVVPNSRVRAGCDIPGLRAAESNHTCTLSQVGEENSHQVPDGPTPHETEANVAEYSHEGEGLGNRRGNGEGETQNGEANSQQTLTHLDENSIPNSMSRQTFGLDRVNVTLSGAQPGRSTPEQTHWDTVPEKEDPRPHMQSEGGGVKRHPGPEASQRDDDGPRLTIEVMPLEGRWTPPSPWPTEEAKPEESWGTEGIPWQAEGTKPTTGRSCPRSLSAAGEQGVLEPSTSGAGRGMLLRPWTRPPPGK